MNSLITLTCPSCGSALKVDSSGYKTKCNFCQTEILIKDFITEQRVDKSDKLISLNELAENAVKNYHYDKAYGYYEEICKLEPSKENLAYMNFYGYASGDIEYIEPLLNDLYAFEPKRHRILIDRLRTIVKKKKNDEFMNGKLTLEQADAKYDPVIRALSEEYEKLKTKKCHCGATLEYNVDICPKCNTSYSEYQRQLSEEAALKHKAKKKKIIKLIVLIGVPIAVIGIIFSFIVNNSRVSDIKQAIKSKDYSTAQSLLDDYKKSNSQRAEVYELYADLYLAENAPQKAVGILEEGLNKVTSGKDSLQTKLDTIRNEYNLTQKE